jgi:hypothetical protein
MDKNELMTAVQEMESKDIVKMTAAKEKLDARVMELADRKFQLSAVFVTDLLNLPIDAEVPCADVIEKTCKVVRVSCGMTAQYYAQSPATKTVYTISNGGITQTNITPGSPSNLTFYEYESGESYLYLADMASQKYDSLAKVAKEQQEALNRKENRDMIDIFFDAAEGLSNVYANSSGDSVIDFEVLVNMVRSLAKYGKGKYVAISGTDVATDLVLMPYTENKYAKYTAIDAGISEVIVVENFTYTHSGTITVMPSDRLLVVATSDAEDNRPAIFARRKLSEIVTGTDQKERLTNADGPTAQVGTAKKWGFTVDTMEEIAGVVVNPYCFAAYQKASSYTNV